MMMPRSPLIFLLSFAVYASAQPPASEDKEAVITRMEMRTLDLNHYAPPAPNDSFSRRVFDLFIKRLDPQKRFLIRADVDSLSRYRDSLEDQLLKGHYDFCEVADSVLSRRVRQTRSMARQFLEGPVNLDEKDSISTDAEKQEYAKSEDELRQRWVRLLKYQILSRIEGKLEEKAGKDTTAAKGKPLPAPDTATIHAAIAYVERNLDRSFNRMIKEDKLDRVAVYLNTVANSYDPHTDYMKPQVRQEFDLTMTGKLEGIGAVLQEDDGFIKVVSIVPGSVAWKQKELKAEDKILKVAQGAEEPVDIVDMGVEYAVHLIRGKKGTEVRLTIQKPNGQTKVISLIRDVVVVEESYAKSAVLESKGSKRRIGYILLPAFYRDFDNSKSRSSSGDVRSALEKLKAKNVDGIILDLRGNGGGSLEDAVAMAGLFIKEGPIVQVKSHNGFIDVKSDDDPAVVYSGPLVIMVNTFSASASEILAAALQDYDRAVIVGTDTTWGKGTVQILVDLDRQPWSVPESLKPLGTVKPTIQKFYRVNGGSTQLRGVAPNIMLPDAYTELDVGERSMEYALPWDTVKPLDIDRWQGMPLAELKTKSAARVAASPYFQQMNGFLKRQEVLRKRKYASISTNDYFADRERGRHESDTLEALQKKATDLVAEPLDKERAAMSPEASAAADSVERDKAKTWKEQLGRDFYLHEAVDIVGDWAGKKK